MHGDNIVLFDGTCNFCTRSVRFIIRHDRKAVFTFAALQSDAGQRLCREHGINPDPDVVQSFLLIRGERVYRRSEAAIECARIFGGIWRALTVFQVLPRGVRDRAHAVLAKHRYRWFGRSDRCPAPTADWRARFLE